MNLHSFTPFLSIFIVLIYIVLAAFIITMFYRLVRAVERIAATLEKN